MADMVCICDTCRPGKMACWPRGGEWAYPDQEPTEVCKGYRKWVDTNWERLFGTPERTARTIVDGCLSDCYACMMEGSPCYGKFNAEEDDIPAIIGWLNEEVRE